MMAAALLCAAACADTGDDAAHRDCFRKAVETRTDRSIEPTGRAAPRGHAARKKPAGSATPDTAMGSSCGCEREPIEWDGTGRAEAVRGT
jgi:hypothetical protein